MTSINDMTPGKDAFAVVFCFTASIRTFYSYLIA